MSNSKSFDISEALVWEAFYRVKKNQGSEGVDDQSIMEFEMELERNLYKIWNRMASGSYFPPPVKVVEIPKANGGKRALGIPTVADRVAQMVVKIVLEPLVEPRFHESSYGYRPNKSALQAVEKARTNCWGNDWVIDLDIKGFFDNISHELLERALTRHTKIPWVKLYIGRWLRAPAIKADGTKVERTKGTPQGGVISPLLANLFLHYAFDEWMKRNHPDILFERYADDMVIHCKSREKSEEVLESIRKRFTECELELHPDKTRIVYCLDDNRQGNYENTSFDFLGYTFIARPAKTRWGKVFINFSPAMTSSAAKKIRERIRSWRIPSTRHNLKLEDIAELVNPSLRGWIAYYGKFYKSICLKILGYFNTILKAWAKRKYKGKGSVTDWLQAIAKRRPQLFVLWQHGAFPATSE